MARDFEDLPLNADSDDSLPDFCTSLVSNLDRMFTYGPDFNSTLTPSTKGMICTRTSNLADDLGEGRRGEKNVK